jgi:hypothetical protein
VNSNSDFMSDTIALFQWAVGEPEARPQDFTESTTGEREVLVLPRLERVAPEAVLPDVPGTSERPSLLRVLSRQKPAFLRRKAATAHKTCYFPTSCAGACFIGRWERRSS